MRTGDAGVSAGDGFLQARPAFHAFVLKFIDLGIVIYGQI